MKNTERSWKCLICGEIVKGPNPPEKCPVCGVGPEQFVEVQEQQVEVKSMAAEDFIIVGGGIAGLKAAEAIRQRNPLARIEIISDEEVFCYNRPMLTKGILQQLNAENFFTKMLDWYRENKIKTTLGQKVEAIDREAKTVRLASGEVKSYDKLIYAAGAECNVPPIKGHEKAGVQVIRKLKDMHAIRERLPEISSAAVIGGGILGLEAAWELLQAGKAVTVVEISDRIMGRQLDEKGAALLTAAAEKAGASIVTGHGIEEIAGDEKAVGIKTADGKLHEAQLVIISAGNRPNTALAQAAGLHVERLVEVDDHMQTSDPSIYACGDVAAVNGVSVGIWPQAEAMGTVAGANAAGDDISYEPVTPANAFDGFGVQLFSIGDVNGDASSVSRESVDADNGIYKKLCFRDGVLCGGILMGDITGAGKLTDVYKEKCAADDPRLQELL